MHEPTEELFLGVIHPDAALFADYFNVDQASREHRNYRKALTEAGARVLTVREVLLDGTLDGEGNAVEGLALDALRTFAGEFLVYNTDAIPAQRDAQRAYKEEVLRKANPKDLLRIILLQPEVVLSHTEGNTGFAATYRQRPMMNLFYMRDQMIATFKGLVIARMHSPQREVESRVAEFCLNKIGMPPIGRISGEGAYLEGGDFLPFGSSAVRAVSASSRCPMRKRVRRPSTSSWRTTGSVRTGSWLFGTTGSNRNRCTSIPISTASTATW